MSIENIYRQCLRPSKDFDSIDYFTQIEKTYYLQLGMLGIDEALIFACLLVYIVIENNQIVSIALRRPVVSYGYSPLTRHQYCATVQHKPRPNLLNMHLLTMKSNSLRRQLSVHPLSDVAGGVLYPRACCSDIAHSVSILLCPPISVWIRQTYIKSLSGL